jgi:protein SCO1/2
MKRLLCLLLLLCLAPSRPASAVETPSGKTIVGDVRSYSARGVIVEIKPGGGEVVIRHEAVPGFMPAMTMPFHVKSTNELVGLTVGDAISFRLIIAGEQSWIENLEKTGHEAVSSTSPPPVASLSRRAGHPLLDYKFTNELGASVSFNDFRGDVIVYTFFFTRCPVPDYCPRLSRNFEAVTKKLAATTNGPMNYHLLSVSFDPEFDTPSALREYARRYNYDSNHWSFLTGPKEKIGELARLSGATYSPEEGLFTHNFKTLVIDPAGRLRMSYPIGGDLSDALVEDILAAAAATNAGPSWRDSIK